MDKRLEYILSEIDENDEILDLGCVDHHSESSRGNTWLHRHLYNKSKNVVGLDMLESDVNRLNKEGYNILIGNAQNFDLGRQFDVIVAGELIEHLANPEGLLKSCKKHLKPDGKLIITTPNVWNILHLISVLLYKKVNINSEHVLWHDETTLSQLLDRYGFKVINVKYIPIKRGKGWKLSYLIYKLGFKVFGAERFICIAKTQINYWHCRNPNNFTFETL